MPKFPEAIQTRVPAGTSLALHDLALAEGKKPGDLIREAVMARIAEAQAVSSVAAKAA